MRQEITVDRIAPKNLQPEDVPLFEGAFSVKFERLHPTQVSHCWVLQDTVFSPGEVKFYSAYTHISNLGPPQFAKRIVYCALKSWRKVSQGTWVTDEWSSNFFHWTTDCLPRIWEGMDLDKDSPILLPESYRNLPYVIQSLEMVGAKVEFFKVSENLHVDRLILTARTATFPNFHVELTRRTREFFRKFQSSIVADKVVYISRKLAPKRKAHNELEVELMLRKRGVEIVYAEQLTFKQQVELMGQTRFLICLHGAALTNMVFLPESAEVLELRNIGDSKTQCYFNLASALNLNYYYTLNPGDNQDTIMTNFTIDVTALSQQLDSLGIY